LAVEDTSQLIREALVSYRYIENGSLGSTIKSFGRLNEKLVSSYVVKILEGIWYLHSQNVRPPHLFRFL
jgi:serine/threonine protein kinase